MKRLIAYIIGAATISLTSVPAEATALSCVLCNVLRWFLGVGIPAYVGLTVFIILILGFVRAMRKKKARWRKDVILLIILNIPTIIFYVLWFVALQDWSNS